MLLEAPDTSGSIIAATPPPMLRALEDSPVPDDYLARDTAKWAHRRDIPLAILAWTGVLFIVLWGAGHITQGFIILLVLHPFVGIRSCASILLSGTFGCRASRSNLLLIVSGGFISYLPL